MLVEGAGEGLAHGSTVGLGDGEALGTADGDGVTEGVGVMAGVGVGGWIPIFLINFNNHFKLLFINLPMNPLLFRRCNVLLETLDAVVAQGLTVGLGEGDEVGSLGPGEEDGVTPEVTC